MKLRVLNFAALVLAAAGLARPGRADELHAYWKSTLSQLAAEPMEAKVEPLAEPVPYHTYRVTLRGLNGVHFRARLGVPIQGESPARPWPAIVTVPGYGGAEPGVTVSECQRGYIVLLVYPRSQGDSAALWRIDGPDKLTWHIGNPEGAYYQGAYADVIRGIDYLCTRPDVDRGRIALMGTSQGGGIALAVGALDPRVKAVVADLPAFCNFRAAAKYPYGIVRDLLNQAGVNNERSLRTLDHFDPYQLAPDLTMPVLISAGGADRTCPADLIRTVFDRIPGEKGFMYYPHLPHTTCAAFYDLSWRWLAAHLAK